MIPQDPLFSLRDMRQIIDQLELKRLVVLKLFYKHGGTKKELEEQALKQK